MTPHVVSEADRAELTRLEEAMWRAETRPNVARWWSRIRARPSFESADVWVAMKPGVLAPYFLKLAAPVLVALVVVVALIVYLAVR